MTPQEFAADRVKKYDELIRKLRRHPLLFDGDDDHKIHRLLDKALSVRRKLREIADRREVGRYSGLTADELRRSGTCETDWF